MRTTTSRWCLQSRDAPHELSPLSPSPQAPSGEDKADSSSTDTSDASSSGTEQSTSPSAAASENDCTSPEDNEEDEPKSSNYRVTPEGPEEPAARVGVHVGAKLIGDKQIRFLNLMSGGHERRFLTKAGSSFSIPHEEEHFVTISAKELVVSCGDLALKGFITSCCLARKLE